MRETVDVYRFTFTAVRTPGRFTAVQVNDLRLYGLLLSTPPLVPFSITNPGGHSPPAQGAINLFDSGAEESHTKWLDLAFPTVGSSTLDIGIVASEVTAYELVTANDNPSHDPVSWTVARQRAGSTDWVLIDKQDRLSPPLERCDSALSVEPAAGSLFPSSRPLCTASGR